MEKDPEEHATGEVPAQLLGAVALVGRVLPRLEEAAVAVRAAQHDGRRRRVLAARTAASPPATGPAAGAPA